MEGWIKLHRKFLDHWLCDEFRPLTKREAWENMLFYANYSDEKLLIKGQLIDCKRGQICYSLETYAKKFNWTIGQVRNFLKMLQKDNMILLEGLKYTTRLTICNYDSYQDQQQTDNKLTTFSQHSDNILTTTSKEIKNIRKKENIKEKSLDFGILKPELWNKWIDFKQTQFKFKYKSAASEQTGINNLIKLSSGNNVVAELIINQSIGNGWQGLFPLKNEIKNEKSEPKINRTRF